MARKRDLVIKLNYLKRILDESERLYAKKYPEAGADFIYGKIYIAITVVENLLKELE